MNVLFTSFSKLFYAAMLFGGNQMQLTTLGELGDTIVLNLPASVIKALHLHVGEELAIEVESNRIVLTRIPANFCHVQVVYQTLAQYCQNVVHAPS
jgi:antitoxin component of MazEF toxin-antitoxin module